MKRRCVSLLLAIAMMTCLIIPALTPAVGATGAIYWPVPGHTVLTRGFTEGHAAIDIADYGVNGATVIAATGGTVYRLYNCDRQHYKEDCDICGGLGTAVVIQGDDGRFYQYGHFQAGSIPEDIKVGADVQRGAKLGLVGTTGNASGPHLHFAISDQITWHPGTVDPETEYYIYTAAGEAPADLGSHFYASITHIPSGKLLSVNNTTTDSSPVFLQTQTYTASQRWEFIRQSDGSYTIRSLQNGLLMNLSGGNSEDDTVINTLSDLNDDERRWYIYKTETGYKILSAAVGKAVSIYAGTTEDGTYAVIYADCGATTQQFDIHVHRYTENVFPPDCNIRGYTLYRCSCGDEIITSFTDALECPSDAFTDMPESTSWMHDAIDYAVVNKLFLGTSDTTFHPDMTMSRAMLVTVLWRSAGQPEAGVPDFTDVAEDAWYAVPVAWAVENNVIVGMSEDTFVPDSPVTREQIAAILFRYSTSQGLDTSARADLNDFKDFADVQDYAVEAMQWAVAEGLILGSDGSLLPGSHATRVQVAAIMMRYLEGVKQ